MGKPIVAVSMNYRVSGWGFMKSTDLVDEGSTNMGLRDQRLALHWIQENILAFGGDRARVTIWGESAGAYSVGYQLVAYGGRDDKLFRGAIMESGNPLFLKTEQWHYSQPYYDNTTAAMNCTNATDHLECLRKVPFKDLDLYFNQTWSRYFYPQPDGDFIQGSTLTQMKAGQFVKVPLLTGSNSDEGSVFAVKGINSDAQMIATFMSQGADNATAQALLKVYPDIPAVGIPEVVTQRPSSSLYGTMYKRSAAFYGDHLFIAGKRFTASTWANYTGATWAYRFNINPYTGGPDYLGVAHGTEIPFVFGNPTNPTYFGNKPPAYFDEAFLMSRMWISFFNDLTPNNHGVRGQPDWPLYGGTDGYGFNFVFDANTTNHVELDTFRADGIAYLQSIWASQFKY